MNTETLRVRWIASLTSNFADRRRIQGGRDVPKIRRAPASLADLLGLVSLCALGCVGCSDDNSQPQLRALAAPELQASSAAVESFYDEEGNLKSSDVVLAGLPLPVGLELLSERRRRHTYEVNREIPPTKVLSYLGPRLFTGHVERSGQGAIYHRARVNGIPENQAVLMDVTVMVRGETTRLEIYELPPPSKQPMPPEEMERHFRENLRNLD